MKLRKVINGDGTHNQFLFWCPGCDQPHGVRDHNFNGNVDSPTFSPSILVTWTEGEAHTQKRCHSHITNGRISFYADCTHSLAGQDVDLPAWSGF